MGPSGIPGLNQGITNTLNSNPNNPSGQWGLQPIFQQAQQPFVNLNTPNPTFNPPTPPSQVLGTSNQQQPQQQFQQQSQQQQQSSGGGGKSWRDFPGYAGWDPNAAQADFNATGGRGKEGGGLPQVPDTSVFDRMIQPVINNFEQLIGTQQQASANRISQLGTERQTQLETQKAQFAGQEQELGRQTTSQTERVNNAIEEAKRMYDEVQRGNLARYGTSTGTGGFLSELGYRDTARNIAQLHQGLTQSLQDINDKITQVKQMGELAIRGTNERFDAQIQTERDNLQKYITQIQGNEAMLQANKAQMANQAIQHYQDTVVNLNAQRQAQQQQWAIAQLNADTQLKIYGQRSQSMINDLASKTSNINITPAPVAQMPKLSQDQGTALIGQYFKPGTLGGFSLPQDTGQLLLGQNQNPNQNIFNP